MKRINDVSSGSNVLHVALKPIKFLALILNLSPPRQGQDQRQISAAHVGRGELRMELLLRDAT